MVLAAAVALAISPAAAPCEPPPDATVLAESRKVVVWRRHKQVSACAKRTGRRRSLVSLDHGLRVIRVFLPGERVVLAVGVERFSELVLYRLGRSHEPLYLSGGFADVTELVRNRRGRFAWIETTGGETECPCSVLAGDAHERFVVARRRRRPNDLHIAPYTVAFESREGYEAIHVPFVTRHRIDVRPDPGGAPLRVPAHGFAAARHPPPRPGARGHRHPDRDRRRLQRHDRPRPAAAGDA